MVRRHSVSETDLSNRSHVDTSVDAVPTFSNAPITEKQFT